MHAFIKNCITGCFGSKCFGKKWQQPMILVISKRKIIINDSFFCYALMLDRNHIHLTGLDWA